MPLHTKDSNEKKRLKPELLEIVKDVSNPLLKENGRTKSEVIYLDTEVIEGLSLGSMHTGILLRNGTCKLLGLNEY